LGPISRTKKKKKKKNNKEEERAIHTGGTGGKKVRHPERQPMRPITSDGKEGKKGTSGWLSSKGEGIPPSTLTSEKALLEGTIAEKRKKNSVASREKEKERLVEQTEETKVSSSPKDV